MADYWLKTRDMMQREVMLAAPPKRIVSVVPSQTELLFDLGLEAEVVGITKFCIHPEKWFRSKERVGGTKQLNIEKIASLQPDLILANKEENEKQQMEALEKIAPVWLSDITTLPEALTMIEQVGNICDRSEKAKAISKGIQTAFESLQVSRQPLRVAYAIWRNPWMWAAAGTFIHDLFCRAGWENVLAGQVRYPEISLEAVRHLNPELILLSSEPYPFGEKHIPEVQAACPSAKIILADGEMFSWYGSRLLQAPGYFERLIAAGQE